uniref:(northern house mosquito) hypothetical protein n=1 Tax=Culex pipiens TaxID=7175 RepID=A0A8D8CC45_CULPI
MFLVNLKVKVDVIQLAISGHDGRSADFAEEAGYPAEQTGGAESVRRALQGGRTRVPAGSSTRNAERRVLGVHGPTDEAGVAAGRKGCGQVRGRGAEGQAGGRVTS